MKKTIFAMTGAFGSGLVCIQLLSWKEELAIIWCMILGVYFSLNVLKSLEEKND